MKRRERQILAHRHRQHQAFRLSVLGDERHADARRLRRMGARRRRWRASDPDFAGDAAQDAEQSQQQFALSLPVETAEANDFARVNGERDVAQTVPPVQVLHLETAASAAFGARDGFRRKNVAVLAPDHHFDDFVVGLRSGHVGRDIGAVPEHRAFVGEFRDLMHAVGNVQEREPFLAQALEDDEHLGDIGGGERRSRLVENENARLARQRLGDLDHLPARQGQVLHQGHRMDIRRSGALERLLGEAPLRAAVNHSEAARRVGDRNVVGDRKVGDERKLLEDADDAGAIGGGWRIEGDVRPIEHDASRVRASRRPTGS